MEFKNAKRIWINDSPKSEEYARFVDRFEFFEGEVSLKILAETDYVAFVNGERVGYCQFAGYRHEKYFDCIDIAEHCKQGENTLELIVRYEGVNSACHIDDGAGVIYSVECGKERLCESSETTLCAPDHRYVSHIVRDITSQLGLTSTMDNTSAPYPLSSAVLLEPFDASIKPRPVKYLCEQARISAEPIDLVGHRVYDLGDEYAGYLFLKVKCNTPCGVKIAYGEHIEDGCVRRIIGARDFSLDFLCSEGENFFEQFFVRLSARYLEVICDADAEIEQIGLIPVLYPVTERPCELTGLDKRIYDACVRTLRLCMHTHYEDCPWREQALYALDSRNQMLCGYTAFKETEFQRANLVFISKGRREGDSLLELTYPAVNTPAIPFFSVMYPVAVFEYVEKTGDVSIIPEVMDTMMGIMQKFAERIGENGLIGNFPKPPYWNFYEWSEGSNGRAADASERCDLILNCAFIYSAERFRLMCNTGEKRFDFDLSALRAAIKRELFNEENGFFYIATTDKNYSQLGNAFAVLAGLGDQRTLEAVKGREDVVPATLSMLGYIYDAILAKDKNGKDFVLADIREKYGYMLSKGTSTFWETLVGAEDFHKAGSLCHGWSAMPIVYYKKLMPECF